MKYRTVSLKTLLFNLALLIFISSCGQKISHQEALNFCVSIQKETSSENKELAIFVKEAKAQMNILLQGETKKIDKVIVDTLRKHYEIFIDSLDQKIKRVQSVVEIDTEIDFKNKELAFLNAIKKLEELTAPPSFWMLENGLNTLTDQQKEDIKQADEQNEVLKTTGEDVQQAYVDYLAKYSITRDELKKYGLLKN